MRRVKALGYIVVFTLIINSCAKNPVTGKRDFMLLSTEQEIALGKESDPEIVATFGLYEDEALQRFITTKGKEMAAVSHRPELPYEFKIIDSPIVNAFAVPGGYVYFTRGIMAHFNNEAEFAGVLGHEIGHITARHSAKQYSNAALAQFGLLAGSVISPEFAQVAELAGTGVQLLFLKFGRDAESQSDKLGVAYSTKIGYDAREMAGFFETLSRLGDQSGASEIPTFLSTHPDPANREAKVAREAENWRRKSGVASLEVNRDSYLRMIDGIVYGEDPKQGFIENDRFYHPVLQFQFPLPGQWQVQNTPQQVQMVDPGGNALMLLRFAEGGSLEAAAEGVLRNFQLTLVESTSRQVNGLPAIAMVADQQQQGQQALRTLIYVIQHGGNHYAIIGATSSSAFNSYARLFQNTMEGFGPLNDPDKLNRQPERVRIKTISSNGTLGQALSRLGVPSGRMEEHAVLNGMTLGDAVERGMLIKVVERDGMTAVRR